MDSKIKSLLNRVVVVLDIVVGVDSVVDIPVVYIVVADIVDIVVDGVDAVFVDIVLDIVVVLDVDGIDIVVVDGVGVDNAAVDTEYHNCGISDRGNILL